MRFSLKHPISGVEQSRFFHCFEIPKPAAKDETTQSLFEVSFPIYAMTLNGSQENFFSMGEGW
jgi:hypothetical protein